MLKKNTRKRLLAGALATVMMLTMCPSWALADNLADDEGIATLPANEEIAVPVVDSTPAADTTKTPADPTPSEPEAKPAEGQDPAPAPSDGGANGGTDSTESGNSTNPTIPEGSENNSQNNDAVSNSPENEISMASLDVDLALYWPRTAMYFVLLPKLGPPTSNANQGQINYLPSSYDKDTHTKGSDGGVLGLSAYTGYRGSLTKEGMQALAKRTDRSITNIEDGVPDEYLGKPTDLGFFTPGNWNAEGTVYNKATNTDPDARKSLLDTTNFTFRPDKVTIVWYTIKDHSDGIHVDGYLKGVPVNVTYYSNYANNGIPGQVETTFVDHQTSGDSYTIRDIHDDGMFEAPDGYSFGGWYTEAACTNKFTDTTTVLMTDLPLYAKWELNTHKVTWKIDDTTLTTETVPHGETPKQNPEAIKPSDKQFDYTFKGWKLEGDTTDTTVEPTNIPVTKDVTYVAVFDKTERNYTVTWKNGETTLDTEKVPYNGKPTMDPRDKASKPSDKQFDYTFKGWKLEGDTTDTTVNPKERKVTGNVTYVAVFTPVAREYTVTYYINGTEQYETTKKYAVGTEVPVEPTPT